MPSGNSSIRVMLRSMRWLSLILIVSLLAQLIVPAFPTRSAHAAPPHTQPAAGAVAPAQRLAQFEGALDQLAAAKGDASFAIGLLAVERTWENVLQADRQLRAALDEQVRDLTARRLSAAAETSAATRAEYDRRMAGVTARYNALRDAALNHRVALRPAINSLLAALGDSPEAPPGIDLLPTRPAPQTREVGYRPALGAAARSPSPAWMGIDRDTRPAAADLASTEDAEITPEIQALADQLAHSPVAIYEYVRNHIAFEPYYGSHKGALLTLWERSGNDVDTASLLIALLRASNIPARYVRGTVALDEASARNWVGNAPDLATAARILSLGGVPVSVSGDGRLVKEHVWVEAAIDARISLPIILRSGLASASGAGLGDSPALRRPGGVATEPVVAGANWVALDAGFKQYTFVEPTDLSAITNFDAASWVNEVRGAGEIDDSQHALLGTPKLPSADEPENDDSDIAFADFKAQQTAARTSDYIAAHPELTNADLLGGAYIIPAAPGRLPTTLPFAILPGEPIDRYSELPASLRDAVTIALLTQSGTPIISYTASFPSLANRRVTISYEPATPNDQSVIDSYGGSLLTTPPVIDLVPVLRIGGAEVARGGAADMGSFQTRQLTFTSASGHSNTVQNRIAVGDVIAIGLGYGRSSAEAIAASQQRLAAARDALPKDAEGNPDVNAPGNMAEPIIGETLHQSMVAYFNQLDTYSELVARGRHVRWFRYLSAGIATQNIAFSYFFGIPFLTLGGGMGFDIQQNVLGMVSLRGQPDDERIFLQTIGYMSSALEHSLFENLGRGAVSTIRLLSLALDQGIPVYRIDSTNKSALLPRLQLSSFVESYIADALNQGLVVTVSEREITANEWSGVGFIVLNPGNGAAGYLISGGLAGNVQTINGGAIWDILKSIAAYAWLGINLGLDLWGVWAGIALLLTPEPTLLTKAAGIALIIANLAALGFEIGDLNGLLKGDISASQYIGEQITGLIIEAILKRTGIAAAAEIVRRIGPDAASKVAKQLSKVTGGASDRLLTRGFSDNELVDLSRRLTTPEAWSSVADLAEGRGDDIARRVVNNDYFDGKNAVERVARAINDAPDAPGLDQTIAKAADRSDFGYPYELERAIANQNSGQKVVEYGKRVDVEFQRITLDADGNPVLGPLDTQALEGDLVLEGNVWVDAKHGPQGNGEERIWNQIQKAQAAIDQGLIEEFRFECSSTIGQKMQQWAAINAPGVQFVTNLGDGFP